LLEIGKFFHPITLSLSDLFSVDFSRSSNYKKLDKMLY
jgi:hypothetical protein